MIESYKFGEIRVRGSTYQNDIIVFPDHIESKWWRKQGHSVEIDDIKAVIKTKPEIIIFGTGQPGQMQVPGKTLDELTQMHIRTIVMPTEDACKEYNRIAPQKRTVACLHLTC